MKKQAARKAPARKKTAPRKKAAPIVQQVQFRLGTEKRSWFMDSKNPDLRDWACSEQDLVARACKLASGYDARSMAQQGLQLMAKRLISTALSTDAHSAKTGVVGRADDRLAAAYKKLKSEGKDITPSTLGRSAEPVASFRTAKRFLDRLHSSKA